MNVTVRQNQSIFDVAILSGSIENIYTIIQDSGIDEGVSYDFTGSTLIYTPSEFKQKEATKLANTINKVVTIRTEQSIFDLALQYYGSVEKVYELIQNNTFIDSVIDDSINKNNLVYTELNTAIPLFFRTNNLTVATNVPKPEFLLTESLEFITTELEENISL